MYNILNKTLLLFQTDKIVKESLHMFETQKNEWMNNVHQIKHLFPVYIEPKYGDPHNVQDHIV